jgi:hypothetical protein
MRRVWRMKVVVLDTTWKRCESGVKIRGPAAYTGSSTTIDDSRR